jgi:hypothetical protein
VKQKYLLSGLDQNEKCGKMSPKTILR